MVAKDEEEKAQSMFAFKAAWNLLRLTCMGSALLWSRTKRLLWLHRMLAVAYISNTNCVL